MKILVIIETSEDDDSLHWPRIGQALLEYTYESEFNNKSSFGKANSTVGMDGGPNTMNSENGTRLTECRVDWFHIRRHLSDLDWWRRVLRFMFRK